MAKDLAQLLQTLVEGQRRSKQGSYERRAPAAPAVRFLIEARTGLTEFVKENPAHEQAWRGLSQAEECLLNYTVAISCLERAMSLAGRRDKKDLKRLALLKEHAAKWSQLGLEPAQLADLGKHLRGNLAHQECDHTLRFTSEWLQKTSLNTNKIVGALRNRGGYCDCEVLNNVVES